MRKLLMASAAILGATTTLALAQTPAHPNQGQYAGPYGAGPAANNNNNAWGIANTPTGSAAAGTTPEGGAPAGPARPPADATDRTLRLHEEQLQVSKERVQTGEVQVHKRVVTELRTMQVPVQREEVVVERDGEVTVVEPVTLTIGTTTPWAPLSSTRLMWSWRFAGTRARAIQPASAMLANMCVAVSQSTRLCSMSTVSQAKPDRARKRAAVILPSDSQVPTAGRPSRSARLTGLACIVFSP